MSRVDHVSYGRRIRKKSPHRTFVNGTTRLVKDYGPLHILYTVYLLGYILGMVGIIQCAWKKQKLTSLKYTMLLMMAVLLNLGVWAVEQAIDIDFEFLSVSYIVTELFRCCDRLQELTIPE